MEFFDTGIQDRYVSARRRGTEEVERLEKQDRYPYLRDLDTITKGVKIVNQISIGLIDVPLRQIVGTYTKMRGNSFSRSYMPLLAPNTEFADKWSNVYRIQQNEGLRDPIKAYEFLKEPLIRRYGQDWYDELLEVAEAYRKELEQSESDM